MACPHHPHTLLHSPPSPLSPLDCIICPLITYCHVFPPSSLHLHCPYVRSIVCPRLEHLGEHLIYNFSHTIRTSTVLTKTSRTASLHTLHTVRHVLKSIYYSNPVRGLTPSFLNPPFLVFPIPIYIAISCLPNDVPAGLAFALTRNQASVNKTRGFASRLNCCFGDKTSVPSSTPTLFFASRRCLPDAYLCLYYVRLGTSLNPDPLLQGIHCSA